MEPIEASLADSSGANSDPFENDATEIIFGNGNTAEDSGEQNPSAAVSATAALGSASAPTAAGTPATVVTAPATASAGTSLTTYLLYAAIALVALHFLKHKSS